MANGIFCLYRLQTDFSKALVANNGQQPRTRRGSYLVIAMILLIPIKMYAQYESNDLCLSLGINSPSFKWSTSYIYNGHGENSFSANEKIGYNFNLSYRIDIKEIKARLAFGIDMQTFNFSAISKSKDPNGNSTKTNVKYALFYFGVPIYFYKSIVRADDFQLNVFISPEVGWFLSRSAKGDIENIEYITTTDTIGNIHTTQSVTNKQINERNTHNIPNKYLTMGIGINGNYYLNETIGLDCSISYNIGTSAFTHSVVKMNFISFKAGVSFAIGKKYYVQKSNSKPPKA